MSSTSGPGGSTARDAIVTFLTNNPGWQEVQEIAKATGYSHGHILRTGTTLATAGGNNVERRKNMRKPVIGYLFPHGLEVPGSDRNNYIRLIRRYSSSPPSGLGSMPLDRLQKELRRVANGMTVLENKVEFRVP